MSSVLHSISSLISTSKFFGLTLFTVDSKSWTAKITKIDKIAITFTIFMNFILNCIYWSSVNSSTYDEFRNEILELSLPLLVYVDYLIIAISIIWFFIKRQKIARFIKKIHEIDESFLQNFDHKFDYKKEKFKICLCVISALTFMTLMCALDLIVLIFENVGLNNQDFIFLFWSSYSQIIQHFHQIIGINAIKIRLTAFKKFIKSTTKFEVEKFSKIHLEIIDAISIFNEIFPPIMMIYFADMFSWICVLIFDMATMPKTTFMEFFIAFAMNVPHSIYFIGILYLIIKSAENVKNEIRKCVIELWIKINSSEEKNKGMEQLIYQMVNIPVEFTSGLIDYDWKLMFKFLGPDIDDITNEILEVSTPLLLYVDYLINAFAIFWFSLNVGKLWS
ncbi:hypothetical protein PVAND_016972 [Polypedilum vanderplanki]|uniref:Gustatory receptor n=1 Tax=Polypedilum vanderplanki TaxID=319348 RepID=A0A9J6BGR2_POLVA|nr:hypothetical protein PVAND_016972 [Polypedilum vanderplanki]